MDLYFVILGILFFIFGLLQIILFFKLWAMTNNVKKIAQGNDSPHVDWQLRACVLTGDMDRAKKLIIEDFVEKVRLHVIQHGPSDYIGTIKQECRPDSRQSENRSLKPLKISRMEQMSFS